MRVLWHWYAMGPYHFARMNALARQAEIDLIVVESTAHDDHGWERREQPEFELLTLSNDVLSNRTPKKTAAALSRVLAERAPDLIVGPGYSDPHTLRTLLNYKARNRRAIVTLWSESTQSDHVRRWPQELAKSVFVTSFDGALVAGDLHARYLEQLGMSAERIRVVGNCVDNGFFAAAADAIRDRDCTMQSQSPPKNFLFVGRMIREKNLEGMFEAYRRYREFAGDEAWGLVLVGSGPEEERLKDLARTIAPAAIVFAGLKQPRELPEYYARASCFVLPSVSEPWGLVVNEAMAAGLPVLVSDKCGCAASLVREGINGFTFDPADVNQLAGVMARVSSADLPLEEMAIAGKQIVAGYSPAKFAQRAASHMIRLQEAHPLSPISQSASRTTASLLSFVWGHVS